jgi:hypothetical protein
LSQHHGLNNNNNNNNNQIIIIHIYIAPFQKSVQVLSINVISEKPCFMKSHIQWHAAFAVRRKNHCL